MNTRKFSGDMADQVEKDRDQLIEMREVMSWCSHNVLFARFVGDPQNLWYVDLGIVHPVRYHAPSLYEALRIAWEKRDE